MALEHKAAGWVDTIEHVIGKGIIVDSRLRGFDFDALEKPDEEWSGLSPGSRGPSKRPVPKPPRMPPTPSRPRPPSSVPPKPPK